MPAPVAVAAAATSLYGAIVAGEDGRSRVLTYEVAGCLASALCVATSDQEALSMFRRVCGHERHWSLMRYPRDASEQFDGGGGLVASVTSPTAIEDRKLSGMLLGFLAKVKRRSRP